MLSFASSWGWRVHEGKQHNSEEHKTELNCYVKTDLSCCRYRKHHYLVLQNGARHRLSVLFMHATCCCVM